MTLTPTTSVEAGAVTLIASSVLAADAASFDFTSIPQAYNHLQIVCLARSTVAATTDVAGLRFNNDSGSNYVSQLLQGAAGAAGATSAGATYARIATIAGASETANRASAWRALIPNYALATFQKSGFSQWSEDGDLAGMQGVIWTNTAAITRVTVIPVTGPNFLAGSTCYLYGLT